MYFAKKPTTTADFNKRVSLVALLYMVILSILRRNKLEMFHEDTTSDFLFFRYGPYWCEHFCIFLLASAASRPNFSPIIELKVMISGIAFDRFDRLSRLRAFPYDRFKIYTIVPIVRIELNSNPSDRLEVVPIVRVVCVRPSDVSIWSSRSSEHYLRRPGRSGRTYGNQA